MVNETLSKGGNTATRKAAFQLHCAATNSELIVSVCLIVKYFTTGSKCSTVEKCGLTSMYKSYKKNNIHSEKTPWMYRCWSLNSRRECWSRFQKHPEHAPSKFCNRSLTISYIDSLVMSLEQRFSEENLPAYSLLKLHPQVMLDMTCEDFLCSCYNLKVFFGEAALWYNLWKEKNVFSQRSNWKKQN